MGFKFSDIADPPDMITNPVIAGIGIVHFIPGHLLAISDRFQHGAIGMSASAGIVDFSGSRVLVKMPEHVYQVVAVDIIAHLLTFVTENSVWIAGNRAFHKV